MGNVGYTIFGFLLGFGLGLLQRYLEKRGIIWTVKYANKLKQLHI